MEHDNEIIALLREIRDSINASKQWYKDTVAQTEKLYKDQLILQTKNAANYFYWLGLTIFIAVSLALIVSRLTGPL